LAKIYDSGEWKDVSNPQIMDGGSWKSVQNGFVMKDGTWQSVFSGGGGQSYEDFLLSQSPELYLKLDETSGTTAIDASGNYSPGATYGGSTNPTKGVAAQEFIRSGNTCVSLTVGSNIITLPISFSSNSYAPILVTSSFIWDFWIKLGTSGGSQHVLSYWYSGDTSFSISYESNRNLRVFMYSSSGHTWNLTGANSIDTNWNHYSILFNNKVLTIYLNGTVDNTVTNSGASGTLKGTSQPIQIGNFNGTTTSDITCDIDELAFFANNDWLTPLSNKDWWNYL